MAAADRLPIFYFHCCILAGALCNIHVAQILGFSVVVQILGR